MHRSLGQRLISRWVELRPGEARTAWLMFAYAFLAMTSYNIIQPLTRSRLISSLGAVNIPYVIFVASLIIGVLMLLYTRLVSVLPRRWALPSVQTGMAAVMIGFWIWFQREKEWASVAFYLWGLIFAILLVSQFWTLANAIYDPRQAKRLFGFIGGGVTLGGATGAAVTRFLVETVGANTLLLSSALMLLACVIVTIAVLRRERGAVPKAEAGADEKGIGIGRAIELLRGSRQIQMVALVIAFGSLGAALIDQQLNMAAEVFKGRGQEDAMGAFLAEVRVYISLAGFVLQVWVTPFIHRHLGIGFALMLLPAGLSITAAAILLAAALWAPAVASVLDRSIRYTVDKTTREVLFLPLPMELRQEVKPFVDVTVDRVSRGLGSLLTLVLIQPWGAALQWYQLSLVSLVLAGAWFVLAVRAKRQYLVSFRQSLERGDVRPSELRLEAADLATIETLMEELANPDERRVLYAIAILESLDKRNLVTPLLLYHESPAVRARALEALGTGRPEMAERWLPSIRRMIADESPEVRAAAVAALANIRHEQVSDLLRPYLSDRDPRIATTAAVVLARRGAEEDLNAAEGVMSRLAHDARESAAPARKDVAHGIRQIPDPRFRPLLIPLLYDPHPEVAEEAMESVRALPACDFLFVPTLVSLLGHRGLKGQAREVLIGYGESVLDALNHFLRDPEEDIWVRRHIPATLARIPSQKSMNILIAALEEPDGFLRYKGVAAIEKLRREQPELSFPPAPIETLLLRESLRFFNYLSLHYNLFVRAGLASDTLLAQALEEKLGRTCDRTYRLLGLLYPWKDVAAARRAIERGDARARASAIEYLDNTLAGPIRGRLIPMLEEMPIEGKVRRANLLLKTRVRDVEETLLALINDEDPVVSAAAIDLVERHQIWTLASDLEHVLAHRDVGDSYVLEAASWALAAERMPESRRRALWLEPLPVVQLAARLREIPLFASVSVDELFRIAALGRQVRDEPGRILYRERAVPDELRFLLDGAVTVRSPGDTEGRVVRPVVSFALEEILEGGAMRETVRTRETSVCLALNAEELRTLVSNNSELSGGLFRMLAGGEGFARRLVLKGRPALDLAKRSPAGLKPIEKVLVLETAAFFSGIAADEMLRLASIAHETPLARGTTLFSETDLPALWAVVDGRLSLESPGADAPLFAEAGDVIGVFETLAGVPLERRGVVVDGGRALAIDREELFDLLAERPQLLQQLFGALFRAAETGRAPA